MYRILTERQSGGTTGFVADASRQALKYKETRSSDSGDNDSKQEKFLAERSEYGKDRRGGSYVEHVRKSQRKNQYSAIERDFEATLK